MAVDAAIPDALTCSGTVETWPSISSTQSSSGPDSVESGAAIQPKRLGFDDFVLLEREDDLGGTWYVNHYPGLAVDVPTTSYSYPLRAQPQLVATVLHRHGDQAVRRRRRRQVRRATSGSTRRSRAPGGTRTPAWRVALAGGETLTARYLITATGFLSQPLTPGDPGITASRARSSTPPTGTTATTPPNRRIGIIGTGATAVQLIPELARAAADLTVYQRTRSGVPRSTCRSPHRAKRLFAWLPLAQRAIRRHRRAVRVHGLRRRGAPPNIPRPVQHRRKRFGQDVPVRHDPATRIYMRRLTPTTTSGASGRRSPTATTSPSTRSTVHLQDSGINRIEPDGVSPTTAPRSVIDTLVLATGFPDLWEANFPAIEVVGRDGRNLGKWWRKRDSKAYQGVATVLPTSQPGRPSPSSA